MTSRPRLLSVKRVMLVIVVLLLVSCTSTHPAAITETAPRQTRDEVKATLASLRQIDDLPLYEMTYHGDYDELAGVEGVNGASPFGCSLFFAAGDPQRLLFGRNFDWFPNPALVLHTDPSDGYASISLVDVSYLGVKDFTADRRKLLDAPLIPFDGLNERGLVIGQAADDSGSYTPDPAKPTISSLRILRLILDHASTVDEALRLFDRYNIDFAGGPPLHYLLADATGASAVVEFVAGKRVVLLGERVLTNFRLAGASEPTRQADRRYATASARLTASRGVLDAVQGLDLLRAVAQGHTRWSVTYEPKSGAVNVVTKMRWGTVHRFKVSPP